ncbi:MAG: hypothetical protein J0H49_11395 [Acidobacteria bacterium]|nr:hypothetical protein [Acidobacteriota bacterium]
MPIAPQHQTLPAIALRYKQVQGAIPIEIGGRLSRGANLGSIARLVTSRIFVSVSIGAAAGIVLGMASVHYVQALSFGVKATAPEMLIAPVLVLLAAALLAALPAIHRAERIDPVTMLRAE